MRWRNAVVIESYLLSCARPVCMTQSLYAQKHGNIQILAISERCALHTPAGFYLKHGGHATQNSAPTASACPHALPSLYRLLGGAPTLVPAREGAPGNVPALGATMRRNLVPTRWLLCHSLHCRLHSFLCSHFHCSRLNRLSRTHPNHGSNKNHPNTYPTHRCGDHRNSSNIHTYIYINKFHIVNIAFIAFFGPSFAFAAAAFLVAALTWTGHARGCKATRALTSQRVAVITATYPLKKTILISTCRPTMPLHDRLSYWSALGKSSLSAPPNCWGPFSLQRQRHQGRRLQRQRLPQRLQ